MKENDMPITSIKEDLLNIQKEVASLCEFIRTSEPPLTISIQGGWGCGKSSFMKCMEQELCDPLDVTSFDSVWINAWDLFLVQNFEDAVSSIFRHIYTQLSKKHPKIRKYMRAFLTEEGIRISTMSLARFYNLPGDEIFKFLGQNLLTQKHKFQKAIEKGIDGKRVLVFVDDLDRLSPETALTIMESLKVIFDLNCFIFVLAIDREFLERGVMEKYNFSDGNIGYFAKKYFEKIIQVPYTLPVMKYNIVKLIKKRLLGMDFFLPLTTGSLELDLEEVAHIITITTDKNPRMINRLLNLLKLALLSIEDDELNTTEFHVIVLITLCIQLLFPNIYTLISQEVDLSKWHQRISVADSKISTIEIVQYSLNSDWKKVIYMYIKNDYDANNILKCIELLSCFEEKEKLFGSEILQNALGVVDFSNHVLYNGENYSKNSVVQRTHGMNFIQYYKDIIASENVHHILDVGCGDAKTTLQMWEQNYGASIHGIDLSESQIEVAKRSYKNYLSTHSNNTHLYGKMFFEVCDIVHLKKHNSYDLVFSSSALHWVKNQECAYTNIFQALRPGGIVIANQAGKKDNFKTYDGLHSIVWKAIKELDLNSKYSQNWEYPMYCFSEEEITELLAKVGFVNIKTLLLEGEEEQSAAITEAFIHASLIYYKVDSMTSQEYELLVQRFRRLMTSGSVDLRYKLLYVSAEKPLK